MAGVELLIGLWHAVTAAGQGWARLEERRQETERAKYSHMSCPQCGQEFGSDARYARYGKPQHDDFKRDVVIVCPHCDHLTCFDAYGKPVLGLHPMLDDDSAA